MAGIDKVLGSISPLYGAASGEGLFGALHGISPVGMIVDATKNKGKKKGVPGADTTQPMNADGMRRGGKVKKMAKGGDTWEGSPADEAQDKRLAKKHGMSMAAWEKSSLDKKHDRQKSPKGLKAGGSASKRADGIARKGKTKGRFV